MLVIYVAAVCIRILSTILQNDDLSWKNASVLFIFDSNYVAAVSVVLLA